MTPDQSHSQQHSQQQDQDRMLLARIDERLNALSIRIGEQLMTLTGRVDSVATTLTVRADERERSVRDRLDQLRDEQGKLSVTIHQMQIEAAARDGAEARRRRDMAILSTVIGGAAGSAITIVGHLLGLGVGK